MQLDIFYAFSSMRAISSVYVNASHDDTKFMWSYGPADKTYSMSRDSVPFNSIRTSDMVGELGAHWARFSEDMSPQSTAVEIDHRDHYDIEGMSIDNILQLVEETKRYTDFVALKGWPDLSLIEDLQKRRLYVNTIQDADTKDNYTVIKFHRG